MSKNIVIAAGGTGGHISPGIGVAEALVKQKKELAIGKVYLHSLLRNRDNPDLKEAPCEVLWHNMPALNKKLFLHPFRFLTSIIRSILQFRKLSIDAVIIMGGYSSLPAVLYARFYKKQIFLCEQNCIMGRLNRYFSKYAIAIAFALPPENFPNPQIKHKILGNPLRNRILPFEPQQRTYHKERREKLNILVMGGSQGARQINHMILNSMQNERMTENFVFRILTGNNLYEETIKKVQPTSSDNIIPYANDMKTHYLWADLIIARSGAGVISECMAFALPMILIPYPYAADNHQLANARYCQKNGAAIVLEQKDEDDMALLEILLDLGENRQKLQEMSQASQEICQIEAAEQTVCFFFAGRENVE